MNPVIIGKKVEKLMLESQVTLEQMSKEMQIKPVELLNKIEGKEEFCVCDVLSITKFLGLSNEEVNRVFFKS